MNLGREHRFRILTVPAGAQPIGDLCFPFADDCAMLFVHLKCLLSACSEVSLTTPEYPSGLAFQVFTRGLSHFHLLLLGLEDSSVLWCSEGVRSNYGARFGYEDTGILAGGRFDESVPTSLVWNRSTPQDESSPLLDEIGPRKRQGISGMRQDYDASRHCETDVGRVRTRRSGEAGVLRLRL